MSSNTLHNPNKHSEKEHGSTWSYVVGFILSLIFTLIPYYLVVNKTVTGTALLTTILGFGIIQMLIQIFFFLHLGRGPKPWYNIVFFAGTVSIILVVVIGSIFIMNHLHYNMSPTDVVKKLAQKEGLDQVGGEKTGACQDIGKNYEVVIKNGDVTPSHTQARLCDTLTFVNEDDKVRLMAFGPHPDHNGYGGEEEVAVRKGRNETITLNEAGDFAFHDHFEATLGGSLTVIE